MFGLNKFVALAALITAPALCAAQASDKGPSQWDGYISGAVGGVMNSNNAAANELGALVPQGNGFAGEARVSVAYTDKSGFGAQLDNVYSVANGQGSDIDIQPSSFNTSATSVDTAIHGFYRTKDFLLGLYGQHTSYNLRASAAENISQTVPLSSAYFLGADGQYYFDRATVYAQAGYQSFGSGITFGDNQVTSPAGFSASLNGRYFIQNNWKIEATYAYSGVSLSQKSPDVNNNVNFSSNSLAIGTEYRLDKSPVSFFGKYQYSASSMSGNVWFVGNQIGNANLSSNALMVGVKFTFGTNTLLEQDRRGVTLNPVNSKVPPLLGLGGFFFGPT